MDEYVYDTENIDMFWIDNLNVRKHLYVIKHFLGGNYESMIEVHVEKQLSFQQRIEREWAIRVVRNDKISIMYFRCIWVSFVKGCLRDLV